MIHWILTGHWARNRHFTYVDNEPVNVFGCCSRIEPC
jgi:hypothetical protein